MIKNKTVFFYCLELGTSNKPAYQFQSIALAQGLKKLGYTIYANTNYWRTSVDKEEYLFNHHADVNSFDCDIIVVPCQWMIYGKKLPLNELKQAKNSIKVMLDVCDGLFTPAFDDDCRIFDLILKQKTKGIQYPENCKYPWIFGLTEELIEATANSPQFENRKKSIAVNFRHKHSIRELSKKNIVEKIGSAFEIDNSYEKLDFSYSALNTKVFKDKQDLFFIQSGGRHYFKYIERLKNAMCCATFGGIFMLGNQKENNKLYHSLANYFISGRAGGKISNSLSALNLQIGHTYHLYQWDSWRFWESLGCGCVTMHLDFDIYGVQLPVMPVNWENYIGFDLLKPKASIDRLLSLSTKELEQIGQNGKKWALEHYAPLPVAKSFLAYLER